MNEKSLPLEIGLLGGMALIALVAAIMGLPLTCLIIGVFVIIKGIQMALEGSKG
ncbi:MAG: hypothetical protein KOO63_07935 [Bacteroidales bacterium]|nr:hypothetical protein [Candidatus Latescibacterota bacterium]